MINEETVSYERAAELLGLKLSSLGQYFVMRKIERTENKRVKLSSIREYLKARAVRAPRSDRPLSARPEWFDATPAKEDILQRKEDEYVKKQEAEARRFEIMREHGYRRPNEFFQPATVWLY